MASAAQIAANRANSAKSTGPKSAAGKARSSRNAFLHGLSREPEADPERVDAIAKVIIERLGVAPDDAAALAEAHEIATAMCLERINLLRQLAMSHRSMVPPPEMLDALFRHEDRANRRKQRLLRRILGENVAGTKNRRSAKRSQFRSGSPFFEAL